MIVLDTNVLSETLKPKPAEAVLQWLAAQDPMTVFTTTIVQAEMLYGVEVLPAGKRRMRLAEEVELMFRFDFGGRSLPFDEDAAHQFAKVATSQSKVGHSIAHMDAMIAAIVRSRRATLATRNIAHFQHCGIQLINPWVG